MTDAELNQALDGIRMGVCRSDCEREIRETVRNLRADLATVTAERDQREHDANSNALKWDAERAAHDETRKALEEKTALLNAEVLGFAEMRQTARAALARSEARVKAAIEILECAQGRREVDMAQGVLEALRG